MGKKVTDEPQQGGDDYGNVPVVVIGRTMQLPNKYLRTCTAKSDDEARKTLSKYHVTKIYKFGFLYYGDVE